MDDKDFIVTVKDLKNKFHAEIQSFYSIKEIESFNYLLLEHRLDLKRVDIALDPNKILSKEEELYFLNALAQLKKEIPIQYVIGETEFFGNPFYVNKDVLIPRPETEELVQWVLETNPKDQRLKTKEQIPNSKILDIGTGSGCIAISLAKNLPDAKVWALDVSQKALEVAKKNTELNGVKIKFLHVDILKTHEFPVKFDVIVSNPPYVRELEKEGIKNNVLLNEPHLALFVNDESPLLFYDKIADIAKNYLTDNGRLYFEINQYLGDEIVSLLTNKGFQKIELRKDIFGNDRMIFSSFAL